MTANKHAHPIAEFLAAFKPPLTASAPPVKNPAMTSNQSAAAAKGRPDQAKENSAGLWKHTSIIWIFLLSDTLHSAVKR
jgi:hypothetical protein